MAGAKVAPLRLSSEVMSIFPMLAPLAGFFSKVMIAPSGALAVAFTFTGSAASGNSKKQLFQNHQTRFLFRVYELFQSPL